MATWAGLCSFLLEFGKEHTVATGTGVVFNVSLAEQRSQKVVVSLMVAPNGDEWVVLLSIIGRVDEIDVRALLSEVGDAFCGGVIISEEWLVLRHALPIANLSLYGHFAPPIEVIRPLFSIAITADRCERLFTTRDRW